VVGSEEGIGDRSFTYIQLQGLPSVYLVDIDEGEIIRSLSLIMLLHYPKECFLNAL
jgi:hypothetical protein